MRWAKGAVDEHCDYLRGGQAYINPSDPRH